MLKQKAWNPEKADISKAKSHEGDNNKRNSIPAAFLDALASLKTMLDIK